MHDKTLSGTITPFLAPHPLRVNKLTAKAHTRLAIMWSPFTPYALVYLRHAIKNGNKLYHLE